MSGSDLAARARALAAAFDGAFAEPERARDEAPEAALAVRTGGRPYVVMMTGLASVARRGKIGPLPGGPPSQLGLTGIGGVVVVVFSLPSVLGHEVPPSDLEWLVVAGGQRALALAFEQLDGQITVPRASISQAPTGLQRHVVGLVQLEDEPTPRPVLDMASVLLQLDTKDG